ncbi:pseudouridine synthase [Neolewinella antarctica]|uniref:Pseudouridine synthase n=1 Tax=Neolewinella antarctica TaxID=442734 RepID=A0ABX0XCW4_9BACT|nr:pseudouridine synthase [Neolewinella antarctica]NJC27052.1 23S rRNA pseudouridine2457 synthase [Neolewinella antarctica]
MHHHYLLNKPHSTLSQFTHQHTTRKNKKMLGPLHDFVPGTMAVGRLDENSEGLLLLTTDGKLSEQIRSAAVEKEYYVQVFGEISEDAVTQVANGIDIGIAGEKYRTKDCEVRLLTEDPNFCFPPKRIHRPNHGPTSWVSVTLREGKYRQVRKMLAAVGHPVIRLVRVRIGRILLGDLEAGEVREMDALQV